MADLRLGVDTQWFYDVTLPEKVHRQAIYVLGRSGTGKSWTLANIALQCHAMGEGVLVIDTKDGSLAADIVARTTRPKDTIYVAPGLCFWPTPKHPEGEAHYWGINILEYDRSLARRQDTLAAQIANNAVEVFERVGQLDGFMTQVEDKLELAVRLALAKPGSTLLDVRKVLTSPQWRKGALKYTTLPEVREFWEDFDDPKVTTASHRVQAVNSTAPRLRKWTVSTLLNFTISQSRTTLRLAEWLNAGKMVVCNLGEDVDQRDAVRYGNLVLGLAINAGFQRQRAEREDKRHWRFILDEFQRLASASMADLINLGRSRRIWPVMSHQTLGQLNKIKTSDNELFTTVTGAGVQIIFSLGFEDQRHFRQLRGLDVGGEYQDIPKFTARVEMPESLPDSGFPVRVELQPLEPAMDEEVVEARLRPFIDAQRPFTRPQHELASDNYRRYYPRQGKQQDDTSKSNDRRNVRHNRQASETQEHQTEPVPTRSERPPATDRDDRAGDRDPVSARPAPIRHRRSDPDDF